MLDENLLLPKKDPKVMDAMRAFEEKTYPIEDDDRKDLLNRHQELKNNIIREHIGHVPQDESDFLYDYFLKEEERDQAGALSLLTKREMPSINKRYKSLKQNMKDYPYAYNPETEVAVTGDLVRGFNQFKIGHMAMFSEEVTHEGLVGSVDAFIKIQKDNQATKSLHHRIAELELSESEGLREKAEVLFEKHPGLTASLIIESGTLWLPAAAYGVIGAVGGSVTGTLLGGPSAGLYAGLAGGRLGMGLGIAQTHGPLWIHDYLITQKINPMDRQAIIKHFSVPANRNELRKQSRWYGFTLAGVNLMTGAIGAKVRLAGRPLTGAGVDVAGEGLAEIGARKTARGYLTKRDKEEALLEMFTSGPPAIASSMLITPHPQKEVRNLGKVEAEVVGHEEAPKKLEEASKQLEEAPKQLEEATKQLKEKFGIEETINLEDVRQDSHFYDDLATSEEVNEIVDLVDDLQLDLEPENERFFSDNAFKEIKDTIKETVDKIKNPKEFRKRLVSFYKKYLNDHLQMAKVFSIIEAMTDPVYNTMSNEQKDKFLERTWDGPDSIYYKGEKKNIIEFLKLIHQDKGKYINKDIQLHPTMMDMESMRKILVFSEQTIPYISLAMLKNKTFEEKVFSFFAEGALTTETPLEEAVLATIVFNNILKDKSVKSLNELFKLEFWRYITDHTHDGHLHQGGPGEKPETPGIALRKHGASTLALDSEEATKAVQEGKLLDQSTFIDGSKKLDFLSSTVEETEGIDSSIFVFTHELMHYFDLLMLQKSKNIDPELKKAYEAMRKELNIPVRNEKLNFGKETNIGLEHLDATSEEKLESSINEQVAELAVKHIVDNINNKDLIKILKEGKKIFKKMRSLKTQKFSNYGFNYDLFESKTVMKFFNMLFHVSSIEFEYKDILDMGFKDKETKKRFDKMREGFHFLSDFEIRKMSEKFQLFVVRVDKIMNAIAKDNLKHPLPFTYVTPRERDTAKSYPKVKVSLESLEAMFPEFQLGKGQRNHDLVAAWTSDDDSAVDFRKILSENEIENSYELLETLIKRPVNFLSVTNRVIDYAARGLFVPYNLHIEGAPFRTDKERKSLIKLRIMEKMGEFNKIHNFSTARDVYEFFYQRIYNLLQNKKTDDIVNWGYINTGIEPEIEDIIPKGTTIEDIGEVNKIAKQIEAIVIEETTKEVKQIMVWFSNLNLDRMESPELLQHLKNIIHSVVNTKKNFNTDPYSPYTQDVLPTESSETLNRWTKTITIAPLKNLYTFLKDFERQEDLNYRDLSLSQLKTLKNIFVNYQKDLKRYYEVDKSIPSLIEKGEFSEILENEKSREEFIRILLDGIHKGVGLKKENLKLVQWVKDLRSVKDAGAATKWVHTWFKQLPSFVQIMDASLPYPVWDRMFGRLASDFSIYRNELGKYIKKDYSNQIEYGKKFKNIKNIQVESLGGFKFADKIDLLGYLMHLGTLSNIKYLLTQPVFDKKNNETFTFKKRLVKYYRENVSESNEVDSYAIEENPYIILSLFLEELVDKKILNQDDFNYLQTKWDSFRSAYEDARKMRPEITKGFIPATPFKVRGIKVRGGYAPILGKFDDSMVKDLDWSQPLSGERFFGRIKHRSEYLSKPIMTNIDLMTYHYFKQILGMAYYQKSLSNFAEVFRDSRIKKELSQIDPGFEDWSKSQMKSIYHDQVETKTFSLAGKSIENWMRERSDPTVLKKQILGLSAMNILLQNTGYISSSHYLNTQYGLKSNAVFAKHSLRLFFRLFVGGYGVLWKNPIMKESSVMAERFGESDRIFDIARGSSPFNYKTPALSVNALNLNNLLLKWYFETSNPLLKGTTKTLHTASSFITNNVLFPQKFFQIFIDSITYETAKELELRKGNPLDFSINRAEAAVGRTQALSGNPLYLSEFEKNGIFKSALLFTGWITTNYNMFTTNRSVKMVNFNAKRIEAEYRRIRNNQNLSEEDMLKAASNMELPLEIKGFLKSTKSSLEMATYVYLMGAMAAAIFSALYDKDDKLEEEYGFVGGYAMRFFIAFLEAFPFFGYQAASLYRKGRFDAGSAPFAPHVVPIEGSTVLLKQGLDKDYWTSSEEKKVWYTMGILTGLPLKGIYDNFVEEKK